MKPNTYAKRPRHHSQSRGRPNQQFSQPMSDSGDHYDPRMKATAQQQLMKYLNMAREAASSGDRVAAEGYYQHADHYQRVLNTFRPPVRAPQAPLPEMPREGAGQGSQLPTQTETVASEPQPMATLPSSEPTSEGEETAPTTL
ncbi:DUF4167 domain-containing protein [Candidatus Bealeia paramacronuclearis]|uniref:DUF4167 domain-containing protein n=1 Tax=Candidatus Bealeia paramacronuclearis TaxID=1921001 RepID=A0ABZ2C3B4_9PROT|nr:hypothetical protein [Candidatus Bealeia paramacronuclearis]